MNEQLNRPQEDWLAQLGAAIAELPIPDPEDASRHTSDEVRPRQALPAWPLALSGAGLCLAVLAINPDVRNQAAPQHRSVAVAPQVQGWQSRVPARAEWPQEIPHAGYHGIGVPQSPPSEPPAAASVQVVAVPPLDASPVPADTQPRMSGSEAAMAAVPQPPAVVQETRPAEPAPQTTAAPPAPAFVPPEPDWGLQPLTALPPVIALLPPPPPPPDIGPAPAPPSISNSPDARSNVSSRHSATANSGRARQKSRAKVQRDIDDQEGPFWREKVFGPRRS